MMALITVLLSGLAIWLAGYSIGRMHQRVIVDRGNRKVQQAHARKQAEAYGLDKFEPHCTNVNDCAEVSGIPYGLGEARPLHVIVDELVGHDTFDEPRKGFA